jgi:hypothetical protein
MPNPVRVTALTLTKAARVRRVHPGEITDRLAAGYRSPSNHNHFTHRIHTLRSVYAALADTCHDLGIRHHRVVIRSHH